VTSNRRIGIIGERRYASADDQKSHHLEADLEATLESLRAYRKSDPNFERAIADYVDAEASLGEDPAEGQAVDLGPAQTRMIELLK